MAETIGAWTSADLHRFLQNRAKLQPTNLPRSLELSQVTAADKLVVNDLLELSPQAIQYLKSKLTLSLYAPLASPALTGNPTAPTPSAGDNDTSIATTAFVKGELAKKFIVGSIVGSTGAVASGSGFSSARTAAGNYTITLTNAMTTPTLILTPHPQSVVSGGAMTSTTVGAVFMTTPGAYTDADFSFIIIEAA